jgi:AcrR family transcriptional regulator
MLRSRFAADKRKSRRMRVTKHKSASVSKVAGDSAKTDLRALRTGKRIDAAFVALLHRRGYGNIRVSDITRKADVGRATFYAHYSSKNELLRAQFNRIVVPMLAIRASASCPLDASALFGHVQSARQIYKSLMGPHAGEGARVLQECFERRVEEALAARGEGPGVKWGSTDEVRVILARFVASTLLAVVECFVETGAGESPKEMQRIFGTLVGGGLAAFEGGVAGKSGEGTEFV